MFKAYKYRLYPNKERKNLIDQHIGSCRYIYNYMLDLKIEAYKKDKTSLSAYDLMKLRPDHEWLDNINKQSLNQAILNMDSAFKNFFKSGKGFPKFKAKNHSTQSYTVMKQGIKVDFDNNKIKLAKVKQPIRCKYSRIFEGKVKQATISKSKTNKYFISILVDIEKEVPKKLKVNRENSIGIDVGIKNYIATSRGEIVEGIRFLREKLKRIKVLQRRLRKKKKGSNNIRKEYDKLAKLHEQAVNMKRDFIHKLTSRIVHENQGAIVVEDLNILGMVKNRKLSLAIMDVSWGEFFHQLEYKYEWYGRTFVKIDRWYPSSKTCNKCKHVNRKLELKDRDWVCICSELLDRDINAGSNILDEGLRILLQSGEGISPVVLVEMSSLDESVKQEGSLI